MAKIRNKKTGKEIEVNEDDLHIYGLGRKKLPKALLGKKQHGDLESMYNQGNYDNMQLLPERTDFGQIGNFNKIGGSGMDNPQINLGNTQPNFYDFNTGQYPNTQLPTGYQPNYTYPAQDYGELDESEYSNGQYQQKRPQEQTYQMDKLPTQLIPEQQTPQFRPLSEDTENTTQKSKTNFNNFYPGITGLGGNTFLSKGISQLGSGLTNIGKGSLDILGNKKLANRENFRNATQFGQSVYADAENRPQGQIYGKDIRGGNALAKNGLKVFGNGGAKLVKNDYIKYQYLPLTNGVSEEPFTKNGNLDTDAYYQAYKAAQNEPKLINPYFGKDSIPENYQNTLRKAVGMNNGYGERNMNYNGGAQKELFNLFKNPINNIDSVLNVIDKKYPYIPEKYKNGGSIKHYAVGGINLKELYTPETNKANIEVEKNEFISIPHMDNGGHSGLSEKVNFGGSHGEITNGSSGTPMNLPANTLVFSVQNKVKKTPLLAPLLEDGLLKVGDIGKPWSSVANKFKTVDDVNRKENKFSDSIQKTTADMLINMKQAKQKRLFEEGQEPEKLYGFQGKKAQLEAVQSLQQEQNQQPIAKYGMKLPKYGEGGLTQEDINLWKSVKYGDVAKNPKLQEIAKKLRASGLIANAWKDAKITGEPGNEASAFTDDELLASFNEKGYDLNKFLQGSSNQTLTTQPSVSPTFTGYNPNPVINTPQLPVGGGENGFYSGNLTEIPIKNRSYSTPESQEALSSFNVAPNYGYTNKPEDLQAAKSRYISLMRDAKVLTPELANKIQEAKNFQELNPLAGALQNYDYAAHPQISEHYGKNVPATRKGIQYLLDKKLINAKDFPGLIDKKGAIIGSMKDFKDKKYADKLQTIVQGAEPEIQNSYARANFVDNEAYYRAPEIKDIKFKTQAEKQAYLEGNKSNIYDDAVYSGTEGLYLRPTAPNEDPMVKQPTSDPVAPTDYKFTNKAKQQDFDMPNINMGIPLPYNEKTTPLNYYKIQPEFIDPRYLNVQPQLNDITRGVRTVQNNLGDRSTASVGNSLQAQINAYGQENQVYGNKYNYDKGQDSQAQQFNAQAKMTTDQYNQNSWYNQLEDPIRARSSAKNKQFKENQQRGLENWNEQMAFNNNSEYMRTFNPGVPNQFNWGANLNPVDIKKAKESKWNDEIEKEQYIKQKKAELGLAKNGGKVRIKPKIKLK